TSLHVRSASSKRVQRTYLTLQIGHCRRGNEVFNFCLYWLVPCIFYKAKSVPTFKSPQKGVIMRTIVQKGCTTMDLLHQYSASM
ncbi:MAG: hypothetical protein E7I10_16020, partial [Enterobacter asburiae]|nr:hypothetical protein [Enterobacter asburiae]